MKLATTGARRVERELGGTVGTLQWARPMRRTVAEIRILETVAVGRHALEGGVFHRVRHAAAKRIPALNCGAINGVGVAPRARIAAASAVWRARRTRELDL